MIKNINLHNFRNFTRKALDFSDNVTIVVGPNAIGKTNLLEGIFFLSTGKSFRAKVEEEMIAYKKDIARVSGKVNETKLEIVLTRGLIDIGGENPERVPRKKLLVNGVPRRLIDFSGNFLTTLFGPWDLDLVTESPSIRRRFLDTVIAQIDREYRRATLSYEKGLRQRNRLLLRIRDEGLSRSQLTFWNQLLIRDGDYISGKREKLIEFINQTSDLDSMKFNVEYDKSAISGGRLEQYEEEEVMAATTLVGPHRDDFIFKIGKEKRDLARFGSRGEERMGILWLKLAELAYLEENTKVRPTLLLDDIFSELDHEHRDIVRRLVGKQQTIITTADEHFVKGFKKELGIIKL